MNKAAALKVLNPVLGVLMVFQILGMPLKELLPVDIMLVYKLHALNGFFIGFLIILHVVLNWSWVRSTYFGRRKN